jgi:glyoxylase-like metal-dependent hydrolase (beta-lactamase superfamily II)
MKIKLLQCGYCHGFEDTVLKGGRRLEIEFPALVALLQHPVHGNILFDTGYSNRFYEETGSWPGKIYAWLTPTFVKPEEYAVEQLKALGIAPEAVNYILVSHFHADHVCGLKDFPNACFVCSQSALENVEKSKGFAAVKRGILPGLIPSDLSKRAWCFDNDSKLKTENDEILGKVYDLFGDGSIRIVPLPGHHTGQFGVILKDEQEKNLFLCADACWLSPSFKENRMPSIATWLLTSDWKAFKESLYKLHLYYKKHPEVRIVPTHCMEAVKEAMTIYS